VQKVNVKEVRGPLGKGERKFYAVISDDGAEFTSFDTKLASLLPGSVINLEPEIKGKYINIKEWSLIEEPATQSPSAAIPAQVAPRSLQFDARATALNVASRLVSAGKIDITEMIPKAEIYRSWLTGEAMRKASPQAPNTKPVTTVEEDWESMKRDDDPPKRNPDDIKNLGALFTACLQDFKMNPAAVAKELGYSKTQDITGEFADHYRAIAQVNSK